MKFTPIDQWVLARLLAGQALNGEASTVSPTHHRIVDHLQSLPSESRKAAFKAYLCHGSEGDESAIVAALTEVNSGEQPPEIEMIEVPRCANLGDVRLLVSESHWPWPNWLASAVLNVLAADPGTGKTIFAVNLACLLWFGRPWPDGQANPFPAGTKTLWIPGDRHFPQLLDLAAKYGLPDDALLFNASKDDPTGGLDLDEPDELSALRERIVAEKPGLVIIDTVGMTTGRNLCRPEDARAYFGPLMEMANQTGVPFLLLTHLSKEAEALGRRIVGAARLVWKLTNPDPEQQPDRRRIWVDKSYAEKPPAIGMTITDTGCSFDFNPPSEPKSRRPGPAPAKMEECKKWLSDRLTPNPAPVKEIRKDAEAAGFSADMLYRAHDALAVAEYTLERRKWWKLPLAEEGDDFALADDTESDLPDFSVTKPHKRR